MFFSGIGQFASPKESIFDKKSKKQDKKSKGSKLRKEDIGMPSNFQHLGHVGWDKEKGFQVRAFQYVNFSLLNYWVNLHCFHLLKFQREFAKSSKIFGRDFGFYKLSFFPRRW